MIKLDSNSNRYHSDEELRRQFAELQVKNITIANFDAHDNEISLSFPSLRLTADVSILGMLLCNMMSKSM